MTGDRPIVIFLHYWCRGPAENSLQERGIAAGITIPLLTAKPEKYAANLRDVRTLHFA